jgi:integrase
MLQIKERGNKLYIMGTEAGKRVRLSTGYVKGEEDKANLALMEYVANGNDQIGPLVRDGVAAYVRAQNVSGTQRAYVSQFSLKYGNRRVGQLRMSEIHADYVGQKDKAGETIRREIGAVQAMLNWCSATYGMGKKFHITKPRGGEERLRFLEVDEVQAMIEAAPGYFRPTVIGLFYTGMRRGELADMTGDNIAQGNLIVRTIKGRNARPRMRSIPIHEEVMKVLPSPVGARQPLFTDEFGDPWTKNITRINKVWKATAERAGVEDCIPHDARRTFASRLLEKGVDIRTIAELLGHTDLSMLMRYAQVRGQRKAGVIEALDF